MKLWPLPIPVIDHTCRAFLNSVKKKNKIIIIKEKKKKKLANLNQCTEH